MNLGPCVVGLTLYLLSTTARAVTQAAEQPASPLDQVGTQWSPYLEWSLENPTFDGNPYDVVAYVTFAHEPSGAQHTTGMFYAGNGAWKFRFTGTRPGHWTFTTSSPDSDLDGRRGTVTIRANPAGYGFVTHVGNKWARQKGSSGDLEVFVPQFAMYSGPHLFHSNPGKIDADIDTFLVKHGFTGFHVPVHCRWFDINRPVSSDIEQPDPNPDPRTFEALELLITKVHAAGGVVHLWAWGDEQRKMTPIKWGVNGKTDKRLQRYIAARLGPLPGWTMGYGFDLWEWVTGEQLTEWHEHMHAHFGWPHMLGARATKNTLDQLSEVLDYASYEQHRPDYAKYIETIERRPEKPSFSEDRFRIRQSKRYASKDYTMEMTRQGLWRSAMAGGVANIWGNLQGETNINQGQGGSLPYPKPHWIKTYSEFFQSRFLGDMVRDNTATDGICLRQPSGAHYVFYKEDTTSVGMDLTQMDSIQGAVAVDAKNPYSEFDLGMLQPEKRTWTAPYHSDWAIAVGVFPGRTR